ncbi:MAG TPA: hypothetical protein PK360_15740 [bacterium]|nr:hypothetical protein [bacterium]
MLGRPAFPPCRTGHAVDALPSLDQDQKLYFDDQPKGFGVCVGMKT